MFQNQKISQGITGLELCYRRYMLARADQDNFPIVFEMYFDRMNWMRFPSVSFIEITRSGNAVVGHLFLFIGEDEKTEFLNKNPKIKKLCQ